MSGIPGRMSTSLRGSEARVFATFYERPLLKLKSKTNDIAVAPAAQRWTGPQRAGSRNGHTGHHDRLVLQPYGWHANPLHAELAACHTERALIRQLN